MCLGVFPTYNVHASNETEVNGVLTLDKEEVILGEEDVPGLTVTLTQSPDGLEIRYFAE